MIQTRSMRYRWQEKTEVHNGAIKRLVASMSGQMLPKTIDNYIGVAKMVIASAVDEYGERIYPRKWNHEFIGRPPRLKGFIVRLPVKPAEMQVAFRRYFLIADQPNAIKSVSPSWQSIAA